MTDGVPTCIASFYQSCTTPCRTRIEPRSGVVDTIHDVKRESSMRSGQVAYNHDTLHPRPAQRLASAFEGLTTATSMRRRLSCKPSDFMHWILVDSPDSAWCGEGFHSLEAVRIPRRPNHPVAPAYPDGMRLGSANGPTGELTSSRLSASCSSLSGITDGLSGSCRDSTLAGSVAWQLYM